MLYKFLCTNIQQIVNSRDIRFPKSVGLVSERALSGEKNTRIEIENGDRCWVSGRILRATQVKFKN
jgi:hypothetical protein